MDSLTQITLGAAVGEAVLGRKIGNKAMLWGAIAGTIPDLDMFVPLGDVVKDFTYHRSASHSLLMLALATPLLVWLINKIHPSLREHRARWLLMVYLTFATHVLLDSFTAYGTQIFWPISNTPVAWATIFIIDPLYTLPLLIGVISALLMSRSSRRGHLVCLGGLMLSSLYLSWTVIAKQLVGDRFESEIVRQEINHSKLFITAAPFNSLLWRAVVIRDGGYYESYYSVFDKPGKLDFSYFPSAEDLLEGVDDSWAVQRLKWFSHGIYSVSLRGRDVVISDLRMGIEPNYAFNFKVAEVVDSGAVETVPERVTAVQDLSRMSVLWARIWDPSVALSPPGMEPES